MPNEYLVWDVETTYGKSYGRVGNRWDKEHGLCSIGGKYGHRNDYIDFYTVSDHDGIRKGLNPIYNKLPFPDLTGVTLLIGHNIKFDLIWYWDHPALQEFFRRGGKVWDTMYAEYLLSGQLYNMHAIPAYAVNLKVTAKRRGCTFNKQDIVSALWDAGMRTEDISEAVLLEYMKYDILTTEEIFIQQVQQARTQEQIPCIQQAMEGLLAFTEMEFNGMHIDWDTAMEQKEALELELIELKKGLDEYIPELPSACEFKWSSWRHLSALLFGGYIKYTDKEVVLDDFYDPVYYKMQIRVDLEDEVTGELLRYKGGKKAGEVKTKLITIPDIQRGPKTRNAEFEVWVTGVTEPDPKWASESAPGYYSTNKDIIEILKSRNVELVDTILEYRGKDKDLGTYYIKEGPKKTTGMLTNIQPYDGCVHGNLNTSVTVTRRLSGSEPNLQNLNKKGLIKKTFDSRFPEGIVSETDYGQLEVVAKAVASNCITMMKALVDGVCFHCDWLSMATGVSYEEVYQKAKIDEIPEWVELRSKIKSVTFGEAYGAGDATLSESSGLPAETIKQAKAARRLKYPELYEFDERVAKEVQRTRAVTTLRTDDGYQRAVGYYKSATGTLFHFMESASHEWQKDQGIHTSFNPTVIKNYPSQGLGGEIMQVFCGLIYRMLIRFNLTDDVKLILTVHDSVYLDWRTEELAKKYLPKISAMCEGVCLYFNAIFPKVNWDTPFPVDTKYGLNIKETPNTVKERDSEWLDIIMKEIADGSWGRFR